jgi:hypothetical protein
VELLRQVPLSSEEPESILPLVSKWDMIFEVGLPEDKTFVMRILPLVSGAVLRYFGECLKGGWTWEQSKTGLLREIFPILFENA